MKSTARNLYFILITLSALLVSGCAELIDCVASARPNIHSKNLATGNFGLPYSDFIEADVTNEPNDDAYIYYFSVDGNLPPGMTYREQNRRITIFGTPTMSGSFTFRVNLTVDPPDYYDGNNGFWDDSNQICFSDDSTSKEFTIVIN